MLFCWLKISYGAGGIEYHLAAAIKKKPPRQRRKGCFFSSQWHVSLTTLAGADDVAETIPAVAIETHELQLRKRRKVGGAGIDLDARQQAEGCEVLDAGRLLHHVGARQIVAAGLQHVHETLGYDVAVHHVDVGAIGLGIVFVEEFIPGLYRRIILPLWIGRILEIDRGDDSLRILEAGRFHDRGD